MHQWPGFESQVFAALSSLTFSADISLTDEAEGDRYFVGSELRLTTRFVRHVCDPVAKALSVSNMPLPFGDFRAIHPYHFSVPEPTLTMCEHGDSSGSESATLVAAGELKRGGPWTWGPS
jgi:hypothetical protein